MTIDILNFNLFLLSELYTRIPITYKNINSCINCLIQTDKSKLKKIKPVSFFYKWLTSFPSTTC